ncbi:hypothetical protein WJX74_004518 [Apatococcus lobatus]|uniref:Uncharacterized protein n=1 Tax=Apatococcus lobatus TaxID=904363 RepID=A0AAW1QLH0_9CHLO
MEDLSRSLGIERLDLDNYSSWCVRVKCLLVSKGLWKPTQETPADEELDAKSLAVIGMTLAQQHLATFAECETAKQAWDAFAALFKSKSQARRLQLKGELTSFHKESGEALVNYLARAKHLRAQLKSVGTDLKEDELCLSVLNGLPAEYETVATVLTTSDVELTLDAMLTKLLVYESRGSRSSSSSDSKAFVARPSSTSSRSNHGGGGGGGPRQASKEMRKCHHCGKPGHLKKDCWQRRKEEEQESHGRARGQGHGGHGHTFRGGQGNVACAAIQDGQGQAWILDSGASRHITHSSAGMRNLRPMREDIFITFGNGSKARVEAVGDVVLEVPGSDIATLTLSDVYHVPEAKMNLFSIDRAVEKGLDVRFSRVSAAERHCFQEKDGQLVAKATSQAGVFGMTAYVAETAASAVEDPETWHRRFGHLGYDNLAKLVAGNMVTGMTTSAADFKSASEHAAPAGMRHLHHLQAAQGPQTFIRRKLCVVKPIRRKSEVPAVTKEVINFLEKQSGHDLLVLRSDNGTEYINKKLQEYLASKGVMHQTTTRYTPEQNGAAERLNRTLMERVRAMLGDSGLSKELWAEAACTACYIRNRSPASGRDRTPWELFFGKKPDVGNMRTFGTPAYALTPKELRRKLDDRSELGHFVGYPANTKGYRIALPSGKVIIASDVTFVETKGPSGSTPALSKEPAKPDILRDALDPSEQEEPDNPQDSGGSGDSGDDGDGDEGPGDGQGAQGPGAPAQARYPARARAKPGEWWRSQPEIAAAAVIEEPLTYEEALSSEQADEWRQAMDEEIRSLHANQTWTPEPVPKGVRALPVKWVYKAKKDANGNIERFKARLVAKGFRQKEGVDFNEVFAPVSKYATLRALLAVAAVEDLEVQQVDIKTAFLNGILEEEVYIEQPTGYQEGGPGIGCHLHKALYGLTLSPSWCGSASQQLHSAPGCTGWWSGASLPCFLSASMQV